jgi:hypothetical protein
MHRKYLVLLHDLIPAAIRLALQEYLRHLDFLCRFHLQGFDTWNEIVQLLDSTVCQAKHGDRILKLKDNAVIAVVSNAIQTVSCLEFFLRRELCVEQHRR